jgi:hypothetical protein
MRLFFILLTFAAITFNTYTYSTTGHWAALAAIILLSLTFIDNSIENHCGE